MRFLFLLALVGLALARNDTYTWSPPPCPQPTRRPPPRLPVHGKPAYIGCFQSDNGYPSFSLAGSSASMTVELCAASCPSFLIGLYDTDCYCGRVLDSTHQVDDGQCNIRCPGDSSEACGGLAGSLRLARNKAVPLGVLLSIYGTVEERAERPTLTSTVTSTQTSTITSCHRGGGPCEHITTTNLVMTTTTYHPEPTRDPNPDDDEDDGHTPWDKKVIVCYGNYCAPKVPCEGDHCPRQRVVCRDGACRPEEWTDEDDDDWDRLVICEGDKCHYSTCKDDECAREKVVCYDGKCIKENCYGDECKTKFVCEGPQCGHRQCKSGEEDCHAKMICMDDECDPVHPCHGPDCPVPPPPGSAPFPVLPSSTCEGPDCGVMPQPGHALPGSSPPSSSPSKPSPPPGYSPDEFYPVKTLRPSASHRVNAPPVPSDDRSSPERFSPRPGYEPDDFIPTENPPPPKLSSPGASGDGLPSSKLAGSPGPSHGLSPESASGGLSSPGSSLESASDEPSSPRLPSPGSSQSIPSQDRHSQAKPSPEKPQDEDLYDQEEDKDADEPTAAPSATPTPVAGSSRLVPTLYTGVAIALLVFHL